MTICDRPFDKILSCVILKIANTCNFKCPHCFMFNSVDQSHIMRPKIMDELIIRQTAFRIKQYVDENRLEELEVIIHGGEPLMLGMDKMEMLLKQFHGYGDRISFSLQTNGSLISGNYLDLFNKYRVKVGISLDGYPEIQNKSLTTTGKCTHDLIVAGIERMQKYSDPGLFRGLLCVIDTEADPIKTYEHFLSLGVKNMDFLLPLRNHKNPLGYSFEKMEYFQWLSTVFDRYLDDDDEEVDIRIFTSIIDLLLGAQMPMCSIRHSAIDIAVIETNGSIELVDDLRICGYDFTNIGLNVFGNRISEFFDSSRVAELAEAEKKLPRDCKNCENLDICGSGGHAFRYGPQGFDNPSIYCQETAELIGHIRNRIKEVL